MTTKEAFKELIDERGAYKTLGIPNSTLRSLRDNFKKGKVSIEKMEALLEKAGYKVIQEKLWEK